MRGARSCDDHIMRERTVAKQLYGRIKPYLDRVLRAMYVAQTAGDEPV